MKQIGNYIILTESNKDELLGPVYNDIMLKQIHILFFRAIASSYSLIKNNSVGRFNISTYIFFNMTQM